MNVKDMAGYLNVNEKTVSWMISDDSISAITKNGS